MSIKKPFKSGLGFDSNDSPVINVGYPRDNEPNDSASVQYVTDVNTVQEYDSTRAYKQGFIIVRDNRLYSALIDITAPSGTFDPDIWEPVRTDTAFKRVTQGTIAASSGDRFLIKAQSNELDIELPTSPLDGEVVMVQDEGSFLSTIRSRVLSTININGHGNQILITRSRALYLFVYNGNEWVVNVHSNMQPRIMNAGTYQTTAGEKLYRRTSTGRFIFTLPRYAEDGDLIEVHDIDELASVNGTVVQIHPQSIDTINDSTTTELTLNTIGWGAVIYDKSSSRWRIFDADIRSRTNIITSDYTAKPLEHISVRHTAPTSNVTITLPEDANNGDFIEITNTYSYDGATINIDVDPATTHTILGDANKFIKTKFSDVPTENELTTATSITLVNDFSSPTIRLTYVTANDQWTIDIISYRIDQVDENYRNRPGIAKLATQTETNKNHEDLPEDDSIVTPKTLANRTSTTTRRGLTRLATSNELQVATSGTFVDDAIVTPQLLNSRQATETIRGLAEVATVAETANNSNDTHIITPSKLDSRRATTTLAGITELADNTELDAGTNSSNIVTPSLLQRWTRTSANGMTSENYRGSVETSTKGESFLGNNVAGSTRLVDDYLHTGHVVTPRTMAYALTHYLPKEAKAVDSDRLDDLDSTQFLRSDVDDRLNGTLTITEDKGLVFNNLADTEAFSLIRSSDGDVRLTGINQTFKIGDDAGGTFSSNFDVVTDGAVNVRYNGNNRLATTTTGVDVFGNLNVSDTLVSGVITQNGKTLDNTYVNLNGDDMTGDLSITKATPLLTLSSSNTTDPRIAMNKSTGTGSIYQRVRLGTSRTYWETSNDGSTWSEQMAITPAGTLRTHGGFAVDSTTVIESDAKINYNKLKSVPSATTSQQGIVKLSSAVDSSSETLAATANAIRVLQDQINEKADIQGTTFDDIQVNNYIQIGNLRIEPDPVNETVKFTWVENP